MPHPTVCVAPTRHVPTQRDTDARRMTVLARIADRVRPWRAPLPPAGAPTVAVIGAGPAGLAAAALARRAGLDATVLDRSDAVGGSWPGRYDSLRLNTVRWMSDLPGLRMPRSDGRWVGRDALVAYLRRYAEHHRLVVRSGSTVQRIDQDGDGWLLDVDGAPERFDLVVVASGNSAVPSLPDWPGRDVFTGRLLHARDYRRPDDHASRGVLVVGAGSSGGEICVDLARVGIDPVWSVRTAPHVFPREAFGVPSTPFGPPGDVLPAAIVDRVAPRLERAVYGERDYLPEPDESLTRLLGRCKEPMTADGIVELVRSGRVRVVAPVASLTAEGAMLADGSFVPADDVIAATGYRPGLASLVGHLGVLDDDGRPTGLVPRPGLAFVGFRIPLTGTLWAIETDARRVVRELARRRRR
jgi:putative flavoprotein involved in K+ transport